LLPLAQADSVNWNNTKHVTVQNVTLESANVFNTCSIDPNNQWDNCTAYILIKNNNSNLTLANLNFVHNWNKPAWVKNFSVEFTKNVSYMNITTPRRIRGNVTNITQRYLNSSNFVNYSIAKSGTLFKGQWAVAKIKFQKKTWQTVSFNFSAKYNALEVLLDPDISACGTLDTNGATYNLTQDISTDASCITMTGNHMTFNLMGYNVKSIAGGTGISEEGGNNNILNGTLNNNIGGMALWLTESSNTVSNIEINNAGESSILVFSTSNSFHNITVHNNHIGIEIDEINNNFTNVDTHNNSYIDGFGDFNQIDSCGSLQTNFNFTELYRRVYLSVCSFNVENNKILWKTNISNKENTFDRQVFSWTQDNLTWNDNNATGSITAYYNLSGLYASRNYTVYNNSVLTYSLTTDGSGILPQFSINLSNPTTEIKVLAEAVAPTKKKKHRAIIIN